MTRIVGGNECLLSSESFPLQTNNAESNKHNLTPSETLKNFSNCDCHYTYRSTITPSIVHYKISLGPIALN